VAMLRLVRSRSSPLVLGGVLALIAGVLFGLGVFTFTYAKGFSYLSDDPAACTNCHVMREQFNAWGHSSHKAVAVCNDCHMPHNFVGKWMTKAINGWNHGLAFTTQNFPATIHIRDYNAQIVQGNCIGCHQTLIGEVYGYHADQSRLCVECHGNVGHQNRSTQ
ncbi:MAG TPA: cytochrome c nitrite reductase small subunit, partial [Phototrophicaceae bacterium]|nr:cytochrome c nitrite reductase small subunit [Phototrophicaceae bacterium]